MSKPYIPVPSTRQFFIPPTLATDFDKFLENDIPNVVMDFKLYHNWYDQYEENYEETVIRGEIYPNATKSRYENMGNQSNFRAGTESGIVQGDIVEDLNGDLYILDWNIEHQANNRSTRATLCNSYITFKRYVNEEVDEDGYLVTEAGYTDIAKDMPCNISRYDGRPEFSSYAGTPGVRTDALTTVYIQWNDNTKHIRIGDDFIWFDDGYRVIDIDYVDIDIAKTHGVIKLVCGKKAGEIYGE